MLCVRRCLVQKPDHVRSVRPLDVEGEVAADAVSAVLHRGGSPCGGEALSSLVTGITFGVVYVRHRVPAPGARSRSAQSDKGIWDAPFQLN